MQPVLIPQTPVRRALVISAVVHAVIVAFAWSQCNPTDRKAVDVVDIEMAPAAPPVEALPEEVAKAPAEDLAGKTPTEPAPDQKEVPDPGDYAIDAGVDAKPDAPPDAKPKPDAPIDAPIDAEPMVAQVDPDATEVVVVDGGANQDAPKVAVLDPWGIGSGEDPCAGEGSGSASAGSGSNAGSASEGSGSGSGGVAKETGSGSGSAGTNNDPAVNGAPTTAGTAANLLAYFPKGHIVTALIRFDRLRGTEWAAHTERLLRPMPDYRLLFGPKEAKIYEKLDTLAISTPSPRDATATTLVGRTRLERGALRDFLGKTTPIAWSTSKGGLFGRRTRTFPGDKRVFLSPFRGWFLLGQPGDLGGLTAPAAGNVDTIEATAPLPPWLGSIKKIESETGDPRGPALVVTMAFEGGKQSTAPFDGPLGITEVQLPERVSLAMELVTQGWLIRGNIRFKTDAQAADFVTQVTTVQKRLVGAALLLEQAIGKEPIRVIKNFQFARTGPRVSYTTSMSIADARALLAVAAQYLDTYYRAPPP